MIRDHLARPGLLIVASVLMLSPHAHPEGKSPPDYVPIVEQYHAGDSDAAIRRLLASPSLMARIAWESGTSGAAGLVSRRELLPAAVMLHTEAGLRRNWQGAAPEAALQWTVALRLAREPAAREHPAFLRAWYYALGQYFLGCDPTGFAVISLQQGRAQFPDDPAIALSLAQAFEVGGTFAAGQLRPPWVDLSPASGEDLEKSERLYRSLLEAGADSPEARLHLGRVLQRRGRPDAALPELERVATTAEAARLRYLAHLFIGDQLRHAARDREAQREFERALEARPDGQAAALSLALMLHSQGLRGEAASVLQGAVSGTAREQDPFRTYHFGDQTEQRRLLESVKAMAQAPQ
jgi:tetratricopeptide (TPR) repeat protein